MASKPTSSCCWRLMKCTRHTLIPYCRYFTEKPSMVFFSKQVKGGEMLKNKKIIKKMLLWVIFGVQNGGDWEDWYRERKFKKR